MHVAMSEPVGDHDNERMLGTRDDGFADTDSEKRTGFNVLNTFGKASFLSGFERIGAIVPVTIRPDRSAGIPLSYGEKSIVNP